MLWRLKNLRETKMHPGRGQDEAGQGRVVRLRRRNPKVSERAREREREQIALVLCALGLCKARQGKAEAQPFHIIDRPGRAAGLHRRTGGAENSTTRSVGLLVVDSTACWRGGSTTSTSNCFFPSAAPAPAPAAAAAGRSRHRPFWLCQASLSAIWILTQ